MKSGKTGRLVIMFISIAMLGATLIGHADASSDKTSIEAVKQETQDLIKTLKAYGADQRDEAIRKTKAALDDLDQRIDALQKHFDESWHKMDKVARQKAHDSLEALRSQRSQVAKWYDRLKSSSADAWEHMKNGFSDAYRALYDAWEKSEKEFGSDK
jgi:chromosome segregation ATPase